MLAELDIIVYLKSSDDLDRVAQRVFGALSTECRAAESDEWGGRFCEASGLGLDAVLYLNRGDMLDPEFEGYQYALEITSQFWCIDLDQLDLEESLSEYYARLLAFTLDMETATEIFLEATEEFERLEVRSYQRNSQFRLDQAPTNPKVLVVETREVEVPFEEGEAREDEYELASDEEGP